MSSTFEVSAKKTLWANPVRKIPLSIFFKIQAWRMRIDLRFEHSREVFWSGWNIITFRAYDLRLYMSKGR